MGNRHSRAESGNLTGSRQRLQETDTSHIKLILGGLCARVEMHQKPGYSASLLHTAWVRRQVSWSGQHVLPRLLLAKGQLLVNTGEDGFTIPTIPRHWCPDMAMLLSTIHFDFELHLLSIGNTHIWHKLLNSTIGLRVQFSGRAFA